MAEESGPEDESDGNGILLYYKYASVADIDSLVRLYEDSCRSLGLLGRVRIGPDGVNVTIGGKMSSLEQHVESMQSNSLFDGADFKLASFGGPVDGRISRECGFTSLSIRVVKELVTFRPHPLLKSPSISNAGKHLSAVEFHSALLNAGEQKKLLLLDARNLYETRIGMFRSPDVETLNPGIRQYSDLPAWIDKSSEQLRNNHVLMYCTGGIRCEMASAYLRSKGAGFENVYQLFGGIQRYLEQFPDGGFFRGKNFVFDYRVSVGSKDSTVMGSCLLCGSSFDDYSSRCRCTYCRMLVLVCNACKKSTSVYVCELCQQRRSKFTARATADEEYYLDDLLDLQALELGTGVHLVHSPTTSGNDYWSRKKLRILCLHGFRQNALGFKGRTSSFAKKLKNIADLVFVDAPHELPFIYHPRPYPDMDRDTIGSTQQPPPAQSCKKKFAWLVSSLSPSSPFSSSLSSSSSSLASSSSLSSSSSSSSSSPSSSESPSPSQPSSSESPSPSQSSSSFMDWEMASQPFNLMQYKEQTSGFHESYAYLKEIISQKGPFDGILGFSQGAAMAALVCFNQWTSADVSTSPDFRFAVLCSGFSLIPHQASMIRCPSLHIYGSSRGRDRQIDCQVSVDLASKFDRGCSVVVEHDMGHIIPTQAPYIDQVKDFLRQFIPS